MKPMVPTKATGTAASRLMIIMVSRRSQRTLTPKLAALSSPRRRAVSAHARRMKRGREIATTAVVIASFGQVARVKLPMVQNTTAASACSEARYCTSASRALKVKTRVMPSSTMVSTVTPRFWLMK
jgi:hypothetical protein